MTTDELITALRSGKTLEELATEAGVDIQEVQDAIQAARATDMRERIQQARTTARSPRNTRTGFSKALRKASSAAPADLAVAATDPVLAPVASGSYHPGQAPTAEPTQSSSG